MDAYVAMLIRVIAGTVGAKIDGADALPKWRGERQLGPEELMALFESGKLGDVPE
jgi:hypothetical protein